MRRHPGLAWVGILLAMAVVIAPAGVDAQSVWCGEPMGPPKPAPGQGGKGCAGGPGASGGSGSSPGSPPVDLGGGGVTIPQTPSCPVPGGAGSCGGSPCYPSSGEYVSEATDLRLSTAGFPLLVSRTYLSSRGIDGPNGIGWSSSVVSRLYHAVYLFAAPSTYQKVAHIVAPDGSRWTFIDNGNGTFTPPLGRLDTLVQNGDSSFDLTLQRSRTRLHFSPSGSLTSLTDEYGNALTYTYDGNGRIQQIADAAGSGRSLTVVWGADGRISSIQDHTGRRVQYGYTLGALTTVTDLANRVTTYGHATGRFGPLINQIKDPWNRIVTDVVYDTWDRVQSYTDAGEIYTYTYALYGNPAVTAKTNSTGKVWSFTYLPNGLITDRLALSAGAIGTHTTYYSDNSVQQFTDGVGVKTYFVYDSQGNPSQVTRDYQGALAVRYDYSYDPNFAGKVTAVTPKNPVGGAVNLDWQAWRYDYYQAGTPAPGALFHVYRVRDDGVALDTLGTYVYNTRGQVTQHTSATGGATDYTYDSANNLWKVTGPANNDSGTRPVTTYLYDTFGRVSSVTDALNHATTYTYDALDRVATVTLPKPSVGSPLTFTTTSTYDNFDAPSGLVFTHVTDINGVLTKQGHDRYGQLARSVDGLNNTTDYTYTKGLLTSIRDANNNVTAYAYDLADRLSYVGFPDGTAESYLYYADNSLFQKTDRKNQFMSYTYDAFKRISRVDPWADIYTYDGQKLTQVVDTEPLSPTDTTILGYDPSYRLATVTQGGRGTISYQHNTDDTVANYAVQSGPSATYSYYSDGSLNTIVWSPVSGNFKYRYTLVGQYESITFPNSSARAFSFDDQGRLTNLANLAPGGANLATYAYGYDLNHATMLNDRKGQRVSMTATVPSQGFSASLFKYEYDSAYQLKKVTYPNVSPLSGEIDSWTYDAIGNRVTSTVNSSTQTYTYQKIGSNPLNWQRLLSDGVNAYTYDNNGNLQSRTGYTFGYTIRDGLISIAGGTAATYIYDYQGRRSSKTVSAATTTYLYDGLNLIRETGSSSADYVFGPGIDEPLAMSRDGQVYYYGVDGLGSVNTLASAAGAVQRTYLHDAWGQLRNQTGTLANPFGYTAREPAEIGTQFYRARYYQPSIGRFLQEDPMLYRRGVLDGVDHGPLGTEDVILRILFLPPSINQYAYVDNGPVSRLDPEGDHWTDWGPGKWIKCYQYGKKCTEDAKRCYGCRFGDPNPEYNEPDLERRSRIGKADPAWTECVQKQESCAKAYKACGSSAAWPGPLPRGKS